MRPLLPGQWNLVAWANAGLQQIQPSQFEGNFYQSGQIKHSGIPSIFATPFVFSKSLKANDPTSVERFNLLIKGLFLSIVELEEYSFPPNNIKLTGAMKQFPPYVDYPVLNKFYILKWKNRSIGGIFHDCLVYPGAKFLKAREWKNRDDQTSSPEPNYIDDSGKIDITFESLEKVINKQIKLFGEELVKSLYGLWVDQIKNQLVDDGGRKLAANWLNHLLNLKNDWDTELQPNNPTMISQFTKTQNIQLLVDGVVLNIPVRSIDKQKNIFVDKLVQFGKNRYPDYPIKSKYMDRIDDCTQDPNNLPEYCIKLKGWSKEFEWTPLEDNILKLSTVSLLIWPDFKIYFSNPNREWKVNYVYFAKGKEDKINAKDFEINFFKEPQNLTKDSLKIGDKIGHGKLIEFQIEYAEVIYDHIQYGIFKDRRTLLHDPWNNPIATTISIDFGTTNTSIGYQDETKAKGDYDCLPFQDITYDLFETNYWWHQNNKTAREESRFLPTAFSKATLDSFPSELLFDTSQDKNNGDISLNFPIEKFTIPHPHFKRSDQIHKILIDNFKWESPPGFTQNRLIEAYYRILLHLIVGNLMQDKPYAQINIVPTYPLAYGNFSYIGLKNNLENLFINVGSEMGITLSLANVGVQELVSETGAARAYSSTIRNDTRAELIVDVGGGTTDIAMWCKTKNGEKEVIDSVKYGANIYLQRLAKEYGLPDEDDPNNTNGINKTIELQKMIRSQPNGIQSVLKNYDRRQIKKILKKGIRDFFDGLFFYLVKMLDKYEFKQVDFYPVGNGWRLVDGIGLSINDFVKQQLMDKNIAAQVIIPMNNDLKGAVSKGAKKIGDNQNYIHPVNIEVDTILGGTIKIKIKEDEKIIKWDEKVPTQALGPGPYLNINPIDFIKDVLSELKRNDVLNDENRILNLSKELNDKMKNAVKAFPLGQVGLNKGLISVFLEEIYKGLIMS